MQNPDPAMFTSTELITSLQSNICPACSKAKKPRHALCFQCWRLLPHEQRDALYDRVGQGYEAAFDQAMRTLKVDPPTMPGTARS